MIHNFLSWLVRMTKVIFLATTRNLLSYPRAFAESMLATNKGCLSLTRSASKNYDFTQPHIQVAPLLQIVAAALLTKPRTAPGPNSEIHALISSQSQPKLPLIPYFASIHPILTSGGRPSAPDIRRCFDSADGGQRGIAAGNPEQWPAGL